MDFKKCFLNLKEIRRDIVKECSVTPDAEFFSQHGEDKIIESCFSESKGFYIDIGCSLPRKFSNTYLFYKKGWQGIAVDANANLKHLWKIYRRKDTFLNLAVSNQPFVTFNLMEHGFSSTVNEEYAQSLVIERNRRVIKKKEYRAVTMRDLLHPYLDVIQPSDACFLNVDVELHDLSVLVSNDWGKYSPRLICVEDANAERHQATDTNSFLTSKGYNFLLQSGPSSIYIHHSYHL